MADWDIERAADLAADATYTTLRSAVPVHHTVEVSPAVLVDVAAGGAVVGVETLGPVTWEQALLLIVMEARMP